MDKEQHAAQKTWEMFNPHSVLLDGEVVAQRGNLRAAQVLMQETFAKEGGDKDSSIIDRLQIRRDADLVIVFPQSTE